jgi:hypothetical protein
MNAGFGEYAGFNELKRDFDRGSPIVFGIGNVEINGNPASGSIKEMYGIVPNHAYTLNKMYVDDQGREMVELYNPWGNTHPQPIPFERAKHMFHIYISGSSI